MYSGYRCITTARASTSRPGQAILEVQEMGKKAREIADLDVEKLIQMLNEALAEEWLAYYQYWVGARLIEGPMRSEIEPALIEHATEELEHAEMVAERIIQLGGTPLLNPSLWTQYSKCDYEEPNDPYVEAIL